MKQHAKLNTLLNGSFSNRAFGSSSFHRFVSVLLDRCLSSGSRFSSQSLLARFGWAAACMCRIGRGAPRFVSRLIVAADIFGVIHETSSGEGRSRQLSLEDCQVIASSKGL